jgi:hypothetical protein
LLIVPKRCTSWLQPNDAVTNAVFKRALRRAWDTWLREEPRELTLAGNVKKPTPQVSANTHTQVNHNNLDYCRVGGRRTQ